MLHFGSLGLARMFRQRRFQLFMTLISVYCVALLCYYNRQLVLSKFGYSRRLILSKFAGIGNTSYVENQNVNVVGHELQLQSSITRIPSEQIRLWKNITLPVGSSRKSSCIRRGEPLNLYSLGNPLNDAPKLQTDFTIDSLRWMSLRENSSIGLNCRKIITGDETEIQKAASLKKLRIVKSGSCKKYIKEFKFIMSPITVLEGNFPLAYSILIYTDLTLFQRLLRIIYRPQNIYCVHTDRKSSKTFSDSVRNITSCFHNVFVADRSISVRWGEFSVLEPELICITELLRRHQKWKYFINLTGQEFPLRTNYELVKILSSINGSNLVAGTIRGAIRSRWRPAGPPPHGITPIKGSVHVVLNREFVNFTINNEKAKDLLDWCRKTKVPDETFFPTLHYNPQLKAPGSYKGSPETNSKTNPFLARFKNWHYDLPCKGKEVRGICVFGVGDLPMLASREELFANKFHENYQSFAIDCLEELLVNRTKEESLGTLLFNTTYYETRNFVFNKV